MVCTLNFTLPERGGRGGFKTQTAGQTSTEIWLVEKSLQILLLSFGDNGKENQGDMLTYYIRVSCFVSNLAGSVTLFYAVFVWIHCSKQAKTKRTSTEFSELLKTQIWSHFGFSPLGGNWKASVFVHVVANIILIQLQVFQVIVVLLVSTWWSFANLLQTYPLRRSPNFRVVCSLIFS